MAKKKLARGLRNGQMFTPKFNEPLNVQLSTSNQRRGLRARVMRDRRL
jgi:hypothetical protein